MGENTGFKLQVTGFSVFGLFLIKHAFLILAFPDLQDCLRRSAMRPLNVFVQVRSNALLLGNQISSCSVFEA